MVEQRRDTGKLSHSAGSGVTVGVSVSQTLSVSVVQPWELDNSISPENREVIERMLLEEQYPSTDHECTT